MQASAKLAILSNQFAPFCSAAVTAKKAAIGDGQKEYPVILDHKPHIKVGVLYQTLIPLD
jgi:hypothetical protein